MTRQITIVGSLKFDEFDIQLFHLEADKRNQRLQIFNWKLCPKFLLAIWMSIVKVVFG